MRCLFISFISLSLVFVRVDVRPKFYASMAQLDAQALALPLAFKEPQAAHHVTEEIEKLGPTDRKLAEAKRSVDQRQFEKAEQLLEELADEDLSSYEFVLRMVDLFDELYTVTGQHASRITMARRFMRPRGFWGSFDYALFRIYGGRIIAMAQIEMDLPREALQTAKAVSSEARAYIDRINDKAAEQTAIKIRSEMQRVEREIEQQLRGPEIQTFNAASAWKELVARKKLSLKELNDFFVKLGNEVSAPERLAYLTDWASTIFNSQTLGSTSDLFIRYVDELMAALKNRRLPLNVVQTLIATLDDWNRKHQLQLQKLFIRKSELRQKVKDLRADAVGYLNDPDKNVSELRERLLHDEELAGLIRNFESIRKPMERRTFLWTNFRLTSSQSSELLARTDLSAQEILFRAVLMAGNATSTVAAAESLLDAESLPQEAAYFNKESREGA